VGTTFSQAWHWYPPVGVFIAILALLGVLVPLFRDLTKIGKGEKAVWTLVMFALVGLEIRSIYLDRDAHDKEQAMARAEQLKQFSEIAKGMNASIDNSQKQFDATMGRINTTLRTSELTLKNTQPYASLEFKKISGVLGSNVIGLDRQAEFDMDFTNAGNDIATNLLYDAKAYVGKFDYLRRLGDRKTEEEIANDFKKWWKNSKHPGDPLPIIPRAPAMNYRFKTSPFTKDEVIGLSDHTQTIYVLVRFTWSDRTGDWVNDDCFWFGDVSQNYDGRPCEVFKHYRYRATLPN
jgi:hypothetical protein